jgi:hypothetical protein
MNAWKYMYVNFFPHKCKIKATFWAKNFLLEKVFTILYRLGSGSRSGPNQFERSDPDPDKIRPDPQHWSKIS